MTSRKDTGVAHDVGVVTAVDALPSAFVTKTGPDGLLPTGTGVIDGWSFAVKDNIDVAGYPTTLGMAAFRDNVAGRDAAAVGLLRRAGGIVVGKSAMYELALGNVSSNPSYGALPNPFDAGRSAGGSSAGSAVAVATGAARFALGTDTGGSVRTPAALCGVVGFRPSTGRYPMAGVAPLSPTRDTIGILARSVADVDVVDEVLAGRAERDDDAEGPPVVGVPSGVRTADLDAEVASAYHAALDRLRAAGCRVCDVEYDVGREYRMCERVILLHEAAAALRDYLGRLDARVGIADLDRLAAVVAAPLAVPVVARLAHGAVPDEAEYRRAQRVRHVMIARHDRVWAEGAVDVLAYPTLPIVAPPLGDERTTTVRGRRVPLETLNGGIGPSTIVGSPAVTLPVPAAGPLPVGLSFESARMTDRRLIRIARALESVVCGGEPHRTHGRDHTRPRPAAIPTSTDKETP